MTSEVLKQIWPEWEIEEKPLGKGSFGVVYKAVRSDHNVKSYAAIKVISIPSDPSEVDSLRSEGLDINATRTFLHGIVDDFVNEIQLMESLKGIQNIVSVEDYKVVEKTGEIGWDIYIRMELLTTFNAYICDKKLTEEEVIKLGCDICTALEICGQRNIIHRDIKPENIFVNDFGYFKLGDFGIARKLENMTGGLSQKGTFNYMAPEVATGNNYDSRVDTYSLGIVLYRLLNGNRLPFLDTEKQLLNPHERKNAVDRRLRGEALPAPCDASPAMADVILRACAHNPNMRFSSATEMKQALMSVANGTYSMVGALNATLPIHGTPAVYGQQVDQSVDTVTSAGDPNGTISVRRAAAVSNQQAGQMVSTFGPVPDDANKRKKLKMIIAIATSACAACAALILAIVLLPKVLNRPALEVANGDISSSSEESEMPVSTGPDASSSSAPTSSSITTTTVSSSAPVSSSTTTTSSSSKSSSSSTTTTTSSSSKPATSSTTTTTSSLSKSSSSSTTTTASSSSKSSSSSTTTTTSSSSKPATSSTTTTTSSQNKPVSSSPKPVEPVKIEVTLNANGGYVSSNKITVVSGNNYGNLPTPTRDYYTFEGWYTSSDGGSRINNTSTVSGSSSKILYAHWKQNAVSDWTLSANVPSGAQIVDQKWAYTQTKTMESASSSVSGWTQTGSYWSLVDEGLYAYINFPTNSGGREYYSTSDKYYTNFTNEPLQSYETESFKREVADQGVSSYIYYHWVYPLAGSHSEADRPIGNYNGEWTNYGSTTIWESFEGDYINYNYYTSAYEAHGHSTYSYWWNGGLPVYRQTYTDYKKTYQFKKQTNMESTTEIKSGGEISNVKKYVKYRSK